jgi:hypothetical protein
MGLFLLTIEGMPTWAYQNDQTPHTLGAALKEATRLVLPIQTAMRAIPGQRAYETKFYITMVRPMTEDGDPNPVGMTDVVWSNHPRHKVTFEGHQFNLSQSELERVEE